MSEINMKGPWKQFYSEFVNLCFSYTTVAEGAVYWEHEGQVFSAFFEGYDLVLKGDDSWVERILWIEDDKVLPVHVVMNRVRKVFKSKGLPVKYPESNRIEIRKYIPDPEKEGVLNYIGSKTVREVYEELSEHLDQKGLLPDEYFSITRELDKDGEFPKFSRIFSYATHGTNEGYLVWVSITKKDGSLQNVFFGKLFESFDKALEISNECARILQNN